MRNLRKLVLLAVMAVVALAFSASTASAQHPGYEHPEGTVELRNETTTQHCSDFTVVDHEPVGATCTLHAVSVGTANLFIHTTGPSEIPFSACSNEFEAAFNGDGEGVIYNQVLQPEGGACGREPCDEAGAAGETHDNLAWPAELFEATDGSGLKLGVTFCLYGHSSGDEGLVGTNCHVILNVTQLEHVFDVRTPPGDPEGNGGAQCEELPIELQGRWVTDLADPDHPDSVEVVHLN